MARILALILAALLPGLVVAAECPTVPSGVTWPTDRSPVNNGWEASGITGTRCGVNVSVSTGSNNSGKATAAIAQSTWEASRASNVQWPLDRVCDYTNGNYRGYYAVYKSPTSTLRNAVAITTNTTGATCTLAPDAECEADAWIHSEVAADSEDAALGSFGPGDCVEGCTVKDVKLWSPGINLGSGLRWSLGIQITGAVCGNAPDPPSAQEAEGPDDQELCKSTPGGGEACAGPYGENCGYLNGKFVCLGKTDPDECWVNDDGSRWCGESAPTPPVPDNGTRGQKATPDDAVAAEGGTGTTTTYNYYNTTTMAGSTEASDSGANPNRPDSTDPSTEPTPTTCVGDNCGSGEGGGSETGGAAWCDAPPTCSDGSSIFCAQLVQEWRTMCPQEVTAQQALDAIGATAEEIDGAEAGDPIDVGTLEAEGPLGAQACPAPINVTVMGQSLSLDIWQRGCDMALLFAPIVMALGYLMAGLLFLRGLN